MEREKEKEKEKVLDIIQNDNVDDMREYLDEGGNVDLIMNGVTPLCIAESKEMAELLLNRGANYRIISSRGYTPFIWQAAKLNDEVLQVLLDKDPKLIYDRKGFRDNRETALHTCLHNGYRSSLECVKVLLANEPKIDVNGVTDDGFTDDAYTPLDYAVDTDDVASEDIIKLLVDNGAYRRSDKPSKHDGFIKKYLASKKIGKFMTNIKSKRNTLHNSWRGPNGNNGGNAYQALKSKVNRSGVFKSNSRKRKTRKNRKIR
jgi:ankyrin repeat protein